MKSLTICIFFLFALVHLAICQPCEPPVRNVKVEQVATNTAKIMWSSVFGVFTYRVDYKLATSITWDPAQVSLTYFILNRVIPNEEYQVRVMYYCEGGQESRFSDTLSFLFKQCTPPYQGLIVSDIIMLG